MKRGWFSTLVLILLSIAAKSQVGILSMNSTNSKLSESKQVPVKSLSAISNNLNDTLNKEIPDTISSRLNIKYFRTLDSLASIYNRQLLANSRLTRDSVIIYKAKIDSIQVLKDNLAHFANTLWNLKYTDSFNLYKEKVNAYDNLTQNFDHALQKNLYLSLFVTNSFDSSKKIDNKALLNDSLAEIFSSLHFAIEKNNRLREKIQQLSESLSNLNKRKANLDSVISNIQVKDSLVNTYWRGLAADTMQIASQFSHDTAAYAELNKKYVFLIKNHVADTKKADNSSNTLSALPQITSIIGKRETIPQLQVLGTYMYSNKSTSVEANLGLSIAASTSPDTINLYNMFIPASSTYLIYSNFSYGFWTPDAKDSMQKRLAFKLEVNFGGKNLIFDTTKPAKAFTSSVFSTKTGLEFAVFPKRFSIYGNVNTATIVDQVDKFKTSTGVNSLFFSYIDCGAKFYFDAAPSLNVGQGLYIYANIDFIINGGEIKAVTKSNDLVIPTIQVGLIKSFGSF